MKYPESKMISRDIDWFIVINNIPYHIASFGAILPEIIRDRNKLRRIQKFASELEDIFTYGDIEFNEDFINDRLTKYTNNTQEDRNEYVSSFLSFAKKGFVSMDRCISDDIDDLDNPIYAIVCKPKKIKPIMANEIHAINRNINVLDFKQQYELNKIINQE